MNLLAENLMISMYCQQVPNRPLRIGYLDSESMDFSNPGTEHKVKFSIIHFDTWYSTNYSACC